MNPPSHALGKYRFDAPRGEYLVTYANEDHGACFAEVYGDRSLIPPDHGDRYLSLLFATRPLKVLALDQGPVLRALDLDGRIATTTCYSRTMEWSLTFHQWFPDADAIRYLGRKATDRLNYCFFLDRCAGNLLVRPLGRLDELETLLKRAAAHWHLAFPGFDPSRGAWP